MIAPVMARRAAGPTNTACLHRTRGGSFIDLTDEALREHAEPEPLIAIEEVAARLAVSVRYVRRLVNERRIAYVKCGHLLRFERAEVERFIAESRVERRR